MINANANLCRFKIFQVDAFTKEAFKGNPAGICLLDEKTEDEVLQQIALEMNLSETAFIMPSDGRCFGESERFGLRWFTPEAEVPLCGHATLAASKVLFDLLHVPCEMIYYETKRGTLTCRREKGRFVLDFPMDGYEDMKAGSELIEALGIRNLHNSVRGLKTKKLILHITAEELLELKPDFEKMKKLDFGKEIKGVAVTTEGWGEYDFVSRYFNPWAGVNEDPVTGSAHTVMAAYWGDRLNKTEMLAFQKSRRGGEIGLRIGENSRLELIGDAVVVLEGNILV